MMRRRRGRGASGSGVMPGHDTGGMEAWTERVLSRLASPWRTALVAERGAWLVGGAVRDLLLDRVPRELDVVVEGDALELAQRLGTPVAVHERFGTATLDGLDLASARTESYAAPGALPDVTLGVDVRADLARRDFTVNALAVRCSDGAGVAWPGALADLEAGVLRVLHPDSFLDDPTRLLRLARYAARLGFAPDAETAVLAEDAVSLGAFSTVSGPRIGAELRLLCRESQPAAIASLDRFGMGREAVHPAFAAYRPLLHGALDALPGDAGDRGLTVLGAALVEAPHDELADALDRLGFNASERAIVLAAAGARALALRLGGARRASEVAEAVGRAPVEAVAVAAALGAGEPAARWLGEWRHVRPAITGDDLVAAGLEGPVVGAALRAAHRLALDSPGASREDQLAAALAVVAR